MIKENFSMIRRELLGKKISRPTSGTLSGHAAGESFEKFIYAYLKDKYPKFIFKQYEYLNDLYLKNPNVIGYDERLALFHSPTLLFLLSRGKDATLKWSLDNLFEEKQNDTADILWVDRHYELIDVKTKNLSKNSQAPNIISAYKLAQVCAKMLDNKEFDTFSLNYIEVSWNLENEELVCEDVYFTEMFKIKPSSLYINWAAAMQIQFHVSEQAQSYTDNREIWAKEYIKHFVGEAKKRADTMIEKFVKPFEIYLN